MGNLVHVSEYYFMNDLKRRGFKDNYILDRAKEFMTNPLTDFTSPPEYFLYHENNHDVILRKGFLEEDGNGDRHRYIFNFKRTATKKETDVCVKTLIRLLNDYFHNHQHILNLKYFVIDYHDTNFEFNVSEVPEKFRLLKTAYEYFVEILREFNHDHKHCDLISISANIYKLEFVISKT